MSKADVADVDGTPISRFRDLDLGVIDRKTGWFHRLAAPRPGRAEAEQAEKTVTLVAGP